MGCVTATLIDQMPSDADPDALYEAFSGWAEERGISLYPAQEEALIEVVSGANVILSTPTGSGKSLVAAGAHFAALAKNEVTFYTAPIKALSNQKFRDFSATYPGDVGITTGDLSINPQAPAMIMTTERQCSPASLS